MSIIRIVSVILTVIIAYIGIKNGKKFLTAFLLGLFLTPIASAFYVFGKGKFSAKHLIIICIIIFTIIPIALFGILLNYDRISNAICNNAMKDLDYSSARGDYVVAYRVAEQEYTWEYVPEDLRAKSAKDVGYVIEINYIPREETYFIHSVTGNAIHAVLIDCDVGMVIAEKTFEPFFPNEIPIDERTVDDPGDHLIREWIDEVFPR